uniref:Uncharacterized protein n=1 Tax=Nannospalax galili TaxID=1026970 RepID=A0A8C6RD08_NANGA
RHPGSGPRPRRAHLALGPGTRGRGPERARGPGGRRPRAGLPGRHRSPAGRACAGGPARPAHLLDGGLAATPQPHEQNPWLGAVSAPRAAATAGPRAAAARRRRLLFLLLHAVAEVLGERVGRAVTASQGRLLRPVL